MKHCSHCQQTKSETDFYKRAGHNAGRQYLCKSCAKAARAKYRSNPVKWQRELAGRRAHRAKNKAQYPVLDRERNLNRFGITSAAYETLLNQQHGKCAICGLAETAKLRGVLKRLAVDHCSETGIVRGLLCSRCNGAIGMFNHDLDLLEASQVYLLSPSPIKQFRLACNRANRSHGNQTTTAQVQGKPVVIGLNAYIKR